ncbi:hypothetical protein AYO38_02055 [bacterium SCGC AG-212-C10]|nr:hypothetical protein AYO38_02055 [bacterium SCGC AG-212-C10]
MGIAIGSLQALVHRMLGTFFLMLIGVITARALSVEERGLFVATTVVIASGGSLAASFSSAAGYFVANQARTAADVASNAVLLSMAIGSVVFAACFAYWAVFGGRAGYIALLAGISLFPLIARYAISGVFVGTGQIIRYSLALYGHAYWAMLLLVVWVLILDHRTAEAAIAAWIVAQYLSLVTAALLAPGWWGWFLRHRPDRALMWKFATFGTITGLAGVVSFFNYRVDQLLVAGLDGEAGAGIYASAVTLAEGLWLFSTAISIATYARVGAVSREEAAELTARGVRHTLVIVLAAGAVVALLAPFLIDIVFGGKYGGASTSLRILCIGTAAYAPQAILSNYFTVTLGRPRISLLLALFSCLVNIAFSLVLIPHIGFVGGAWATTVSYVVTGAISTGYFLHISNTRFNDLWVVRREDVMAYVTLVRSLLKGELIAAVAGAKSRS